MTTSIATIKEEDLVIFKEDNSSLLEQDVPMNIFRYKLTDPTIETIYRFAKVHQYDSRENFKEAWLKWIDDHSDMVEEETRRLNNLGYHGDVLQKMFKSARYYFRNKSTDKKEPVRRRGYITCSKKILFAIEKHIQECIRSGLKPSDSFEDFCQLNAHLIQEELKCFRERCDLTQKLKKTYKNRYFRIITSNR